VARIAIIGPGAIGCAFAGAAMQSGHEIAVAGRTPFTTLRVDHPDGVVEGPVEWLDISTVEPRPFVMLATKAHQTVGAAGWIRALCGPDTVLAVLQNGVEHLERIQPLVGGDAHIVPAMVACPSDRTAPGHAHVTGRARLEVPSGAAGAAFRAIFDGSYADVQLTDDWLSAAWRKLVLNAAGGGIGVLTRRGNDALSDDDLAAVFVALADEVVAVGRAEGARLDDDLADGLLRALQGSVGTHVPSIVVDRIAGRPTEWQARNEVVVRIAQRHGIAVPMNHLLTTLIRAGEPQVGL
jgi:2-dehydropantoate 2-reductase